MRSLLTWGSWVVSHFAAMLYAAIMIHDLFFMAVSAINLLCCSTVSVIAWRRRRSASRQKVGV